MFRFDINHVEHHENDYSLMRSAIFHWKTRVLDSLTRKANKIVQARNFKNIELRFFVFHTSHL